MASKKIKRGKVSCPKCSCYRRPIITEKVIAGCGWKTVYTCEKCGEVIFFEDIARKNDAGGGAVC